ncbi:TAXI family TRAP transporter solute-binding subunit [Actinokineospora alba]|nr:TAXI family TRAP transporter solute-binding subunit [Actinokineospora alba]
MVRTRLGGMVLALVCLASALSGCDSQFAGVRLRIAAGFPSGVYHSLSESLANAWQRQLVIERPEVLKTSGSPENIRKLCAGEADVAFSAADVAAQPTNTPRKPQALARLYDDYLHVVVRGDGSIRNLDGLRGARVAIGSPESGVAFIAKRLLELSGLSDPGTLSKVHLGLTESIEAFKRGQVDAFFWSGGLPTKAITDLAAVVPLRLLDLTDAMPNMRNQYPVYNTASIPVSTYNLAGGPVTTLAVPNYLLVTDAMPTDVAEALVRGLFDAHGELARANRAALAIDIHSAIETDPVPLHAGALRYYRDEKA